MHPAQAMNILSDIDEIHITKFDSNDVVRHHLVQKIVEAYDAFDEKEELLKEKRKQERLAEQEHKNALANAAAQL